MVEGDTPFQSSRPVSERGTVTLCVGKRSVQKASHELRVATVGEAGGGRAEERTSGPDPEGAGSTAGRWVREPCLHGPEG